MNQLAMIIITTGFNKTGMESVAGDDYSCNSVYPVAYKELFQNCEVKLESLGCGEPYIN